MSTAKERYNSGCIASDDCTADDYVTELEQELKDEKENHTHFKKCWLEEFKLRHELEQQVEELKKENVRLINLIRFSRE